MTLYCHKLTNDRRLVRMPHRLRYFYNKSFMFSLLLRVISERELRYVRYMLSPFRLSVVCLSVVCRL